MTDCIHDWEWSNVVLDTNPDQTTRSCRVCNLSETCYFGGAYATWDEAVTAMADQPEGK